MRILVVGALHKSPVAGIRALARAGHEVYAGIRRARDDSRAALVFCSRYLRGRFELPHPLEDEPGFTGRLLELVCRGGYDVLLPWDHYCILPVLSHREKFECHTALAFPDLKTFERVHDKAALHACLQDAGVEVPRFYRQSSLDELLAQEVAYPVVVKARKFSGVARGTRYATSDEQLARAYRELESQDPGHPGLDDFTRPFVQEYIPGEGHDAQCICRQGHLRVGLTQFRQHTYPVNGGVTATGVSTRNPALLNYAREIVGVLGWHGPCSCETKLDARDGRHKLLEVNPRFVGSVDLSIKAGLNFPLLVAELAATGDCPEHHDYQVGVVYKKLFPQELFSIYQDRGSRLKRVGELRQLLTGQARCEVDWRDVKPNLLDFAKTCDGLFLHRKGLCVPEKAL